MGILLLVMLFFPEEGVKIGQVKLEFPAPQQFFALSTNDTDDLSDTLSVEEAADLRKVIDSTIPLKKLDSAFVKHTLDSIKATKKSIQGNAEAMASLENFFKALDNSRKKKGRIMHYGDSQIESDRITSYLRNILQKKFGGAGVGLFSIIPVAPKWTLNNRRSDNWKRYVGFGKKNPEITHKKYGALMSFTRFTPLTPDADAKIQEGWIEIKPSKIAYRTTRNFTEIHTFLHTWEHEVEFEIKADEKVVKSGTIPANTEFKKISVRLAKTPNVTRISFKGIDGPDVYGISLEGKTGIVMDNIPLRGSSGTLFTRQDTELLRTMYRSLSPDLIILEFGGNTIPYIKTQKQVSDYGKWIGQQIRFLKRLNPDTAFLLIGPGDMSVKEGTEFVTHPKLKSVREALKNAALNNGALFWDMYEGMGGYNSMVKWVNSTPAYGAPDYIHFSPKGAVKIAGIFEKELMKLYETYKSRSSKSETKVNDSIR